MTNIDHATEPGPAAAWTRRRSPRRLAIASGLALLIALPAAGYAFAEYRRSDDQTQMDRRAAQVMPFDLAVTTHTFTKTAQGGAEQVIADDPHDQADIDLIRGHLRKEATAFAKGHFTDPATIHGADMPGLKQLQAATGRLTVTYTQLPTGARITYASTDPGVTTAIHQWFDAQTQDHAMPGMGG